jgi:hypothetical protein
LIVHEIEDEHFPIGLFDGHLATSLMAAALQACGGSSMPCRFADHQSLTR